MTSSGVWMRSVCIILSFVDTPQQNLRIPLDMGQVIYFDWNKYGFPKTQDIYSSHPIIWLILSPALEWIILPQNNGFQWSPGKRIIHFECCQPSSFSQIIHWQFNGDCKTCCCYLIVTRWSLPIGSLCIVIFAMPNQVEYCDTVTHVTEAK